jgi:NADPH:quinone reductase-like Zn-dependent oxidoreductase
VLAFAGGDELERCLDLVRAGGRVAFPNGVAPAPRRRKSIRRISYDVSATRRSFQQLERSIANAPFRVPIAAVFALDEAASAHQRLAKGHVLGSIVLRIHRA